MIFAIPPLPRHNSPHPAPWLRHIPDIPRNHMAMAVHHRLPGHSTDIEPDVVPGRRELVRNQIPARSNQINQSPPLFRSHRKKIRRVAERDHEQVAPADRELVPAGIAEVVLRKDVISEWIAERALHMLHASNPRTSMRYSHFSPSRSRAASCQPGNFSGEPIRARLISRENRRGYTPDMLSQ